MPILAFPKSALGAVVDVSLLPSTAELALLGSASPLIPTVFRMLIDTGAEYSAVDESKALPWGLYPRTFALSQTLNSQTRIPIYDLAITIVGQNGRFAWRTDSVRVSSRSGSPFKGLPYEGVIGRDVLDGGLFVYDGASNRCTIAY